MKQVHMPKIFVSYRREDSAFVTQAIYGRLKERFDKESIFIDVDAIPFGVDFQQRIDGAVAECSVLLAVIGDRWIDARLPNGPNQGNRRLESPEDFVRVEIRAALSRNIPVIPVLVGSVEVTDLILSLPEDLSELTKRNPARVRSGSDLSRDIETLVVGIAELLGEKGEQPWQQYIKWTIIGSVAILLLLGVVFSHVYLRDTRPIEHRGKAGLEEAASTAESVDLVEIYNTKWIGEGTASSADGTHKYRWARIFDPATEAIRQWKQDACIFSFQCNQNELVPWVQVDEIRVVVHDYRTPPFAAPDAKAGAKQGNVYYCEINPQLEYPASFSAVLLDDNGQPSPTSLVSIMEDLPEMIFVRINARTPGIYTLSCEMVVRYKSSQQTVSLSEHAEFLFTEGR